jgi:ectoine hydroxylase-related dioxygenase (phytanoyl-CoA dioxygenase family)
MTSLKEQQNAFNKDGFLVVKQLLSPNNYPAISQEAHSLFQGNFSTGVYPDEWHWREGISFPNKTKEIVNSWKSSHLLAKFILNPQLGEFVCKLMNWPSVRIAQDDVILKPPLGSPVGLHQDSAYISRNFTSATSPVSVTMWIPLEPVDDSNGTLVYLNGSHKWSLQADQTLEGFHAESDGEFAKQIDSLSGGNKPVELTPMALLAGDVAIHHQDTWHFSKQNSSTTRSRNVLVIHFLRGDCVEFVDEPNYIYARYKLYKSATVRNEFFPIVYPQDEFVRDYLAKSKL